MTEDFFERLGSVIPAAKADIIVDLDSREVLKNIHGGQYRVDVVNGLLLITRID